MFCPASGLHVKEVVFATRVSTRFETNCSVDFLGARSIKLISAPMSEIKDQPWLIFLNPTAGSGRGKSSWARTSEKFRQLGLNFKHIETEYPLHVHDLMKEQVAHGQRKFLSYGGDGTLNGLINAAMMQRVVDPSELILAHYPSGTGNDWGRTFQNPTTPEQWVPMIKRETLFTHDIGKLECNRDGKPVTHYFINIAGMAYDGLVVKKVDEARASFWKFLKKALYNIVIVREIFNFKAQNLTLTLDGKETNEKYLDICVGISQYNGNGMRPCFNADPSDGLLDVTTVSEMGVLEAIKELPGMKDGSFAKNPKVSMTQTGEFKLDHSDYPDLVETDGELIGESPLRITVVPMALRMVVNEQPVIGW